MYAVKRQHNGLVPADRPAVGRVAAGRRRRRSDVSANGANGSNGTNGDGSNGSNGHATNGIGANGHSASGNGTNGSGTNGKEVNSTTVGGIPNGGIVERDTSVNIGDFKTVSLLLRNPDFTTAKRIADTVNDTFHKPVAQALDSSRVDIDVANAGASSVPTLISQVQNLQLSVTTPAKVVMNERTGTVVLGGDVKLTPVSIIHGDLSNQVVTTYQVQGVPGAVGPQWTGAPAGGAGGMGAAGMNQQQPDTTGDRADGSGGQTGLFDTEDVASGDLDKGSSGVFGGAGFECEPRDAGDRGQGLAAKAQRGDGEQVV